MIERTALLFFISVLVAMTTTTTNMCVLGHERAADDPTHDMGGPKRSYYDDNFNQGTAQEDNFMLPFGGLAKPNQNLIEDDEDADSIPKICHATWNVEFSSTDTLDATKQRISAALEHSGKAALNTNCPHTQMTPLMQAVKGSPLVVEALLELDGIDIEAPIQMLGMSLEDENTDAQVDLSTRPRPEDGELRIMQGSTALALAASHHGLTKNVDLLIAKGANVNAVSKVGFTPLMFASLSGRAHAVQALIEAGANVNSVTTGRGGGGTNSAFPGSSALMLSCSHRSIYQLAVIKSLIGGGADVNIRSRNGASAVMWAAMTDRRGSVIRELIKAGANPNLRLRLTERLPDNIVDTRWVSGTTALIVAAHEGNVDAVSALVDGGADYDKTTAAKRDDMGPNPTDEEHYTMGSSALIVAAATSHPEVVDVLLRAGASTNTKNAYGYNAVSAAVCKGQSQGGLQVLMVEHLAKYGADPSAKANDGRNALDCVKSNGWPGVLTAKLESIIEAQL